MLHAIRKHFLTLSYSIRWPRVGQSESAKENTKESAKESAKESTKESDTATKPLLLECEMISSTPLFSILGYTHVLTLFHFCTTINLYHLGKNTKTTYVKP